MSCRRLHRIFWIVVAVVAGPALATAAPVQILAMTRNDTCETEIGEYRTQTGGGWGQNECQNSNVACVRDAYFPLVFPNGLTIGGNYTVSFTSSQAVAAYLPRGSTIGVLTQHYVDPTAATSAGIFASHVLCLQLNVAFGDHGVPTFGDLGPLLVNTGPFAGYTVDQVLALANTVLGGNLAALPAGKTLTQLSTTVDAINNNFVDGIEDDGYLDEVCCETPVASCWSGNPAQYTYGQPLTVCADVTDADQDLSSVTAVYTAGSCQVTVPAVSSAGRWCVTIPSNCMQTNAPVRVVFTATDSCGRVDADTCLVPAACEVPDATCWSENPGYFTYGQGFTACAVVTDPNDDIIAVDVAYHIGNCTRSAPATYSGNGLWCVSIPDSCARVCGGAATVIFTAWDACGNCDVATCLVPAMPSSPLVECWSGNPQTYSWGEALVVYAVVADADSNLAWVSARYVTGTCSTTVPAVDAGDGRWRATVPETCMQTCAPATLTFFATDLCGLTDQTTCTVQPANTPPEVACWNQMPYYFVWGQPLELCATVTDAQNNVTSVTAVYMMGSCTTQVAAVLQDNRWCVTVPSACTQSCDDGRIIFTATDACGATDNQICILKPWEEPPVVTCAASNPQEYAYGQPISVCADVAETDGGLLAVTARYFGTGCDETISAQWNGERWCVTVPGACTQSTQPLTVVFTGYGSCGLSGSAACVVPAEGCHPPAVACWSENPNQFVPGEAILACAVVSDADNDLSGVQATYMAGACSVSVPAEDAGGGRWCVAVPASCTDGCETVRILFAATDACGVTGADTCEIASATQAPVAVCWESNPTHFASGQLLELCAEVTDADGDVVSVIAHYEAGDCSADVEAVLSNGRWCVAVPDSCTQRCDAELQIVFAVTDACGYTATAACTVSPDNAAPAVACSPDNPTVFNYGQALTLCAVATDDDSVTGVTARYIFGDCDELVAATESEGRWCVQIPAACTATCSLATVIITAVDGCGAVSADTCYLESHLPPANIACWEQNPDSFAYDQPFTVCAVVTDDGNTVQAVRVSYGLGGCLETLPAGYAGDGLWCVTIPPACAEFCSDATVIFSAADACGRTVETTCVVNPLPSAPPTVLCEGSEPEQYTAGQAVTVYATVADPDNDVALVMASYTTPGCTVTDTAAYNSSLGRWQVTVPGSCTNDGGSINVTFIAIDRCGLADEHTCTIPQEHVPCATTVEVHCWPGNAGWYVWGDVLQICATVDDWPGAVPVVTAQYTTGECTQTDTAQFDTDRWCVTIPGTCTQANVPVAITFTVSDTCMVQTSAVCTVEPIVCYPPEVTCWQGNPGEYGYGEALTVCANVEDPDGDIFSVEARYFAGQCDSVLPAVQSGDRWCVTVPAACMQTSVPVQVVFTATDQCDLTDAVTCVIEPQAAPGPQDECCLLCTSDQAMVMAGVPMGAPELDMQLVIQVREERLHLNWNPVPGAEYYRIFRGEPGQSYDVMEPVGTVQSHTTVWTEPATLAELPRQRHYQVRAYRSEQTPALLDSDRGRWEFNEGSGNIAYDASGNGRDAVRWSACPPDWSSEYDPQCDSSYAEFMDFDGFVYNPTRCPEHLRAPNDSAFYGDRFQVFARIRIHQHPTSDTGPFYIVSNRTYGTAYSGGFGFRIEAGWYTDQNYVRRWHNRLLGLVWDRTVGDGIWRTIASAHPTPQDTVTNSVPLNEWVCVRMIVDGDSSLLMIDDRVVATGNLRYRSFNTGAPMVIGGGYRHNTYPVENPFRGEMDCVRITDLP